MSHTLDVLDDIISTLDLQGVLYFRTNFSGNFGVTVPDLDNAARFHLIVRGSCYVTVADGPELLLQAGDVVLIPAGRSHIISDRPRTSAPPLEQVLVESEYDGKGVFVLDDGTQTSNAQMVCGHFSFRKGANHPLLQTLPRAIVISNADRTKFTWLDELLRLLARNVFSQELGSHSTVARLSEVVFLELLRAHFDNETSLTGMFAALSDKMIGRSLEHIHNQTDTDWTIAKLASAIGMSRSRFAERFKDFVGVAPMTYLAEWRLQKSLALLDKGTTHIGMVAHQTGYRSAAAFSRAFSNRFGISPSEYKKNKTTANA